MTTPATAQPIYELRSVSRHFATGGPLVRALETLDLTIEAGEFVVVAGASGSGKTTLLQLLGALDRPTEGALLFDGTDLSHLSDNELTEVRLRRLGFVFQQFNLIPTLTAAQNVEAALAPAGDLATSDRHARAEELLGRVGLADRAHHLPTQLSGGEQQRVAIARALANNPDVLLADEPTGNLDSTTGEEIMDLIRELNAGGPTVVLITHDPEIAGSAGRVVRLSDGRLAT